MECRVLIPSKMILHESRGALCLCARSRLERGMRFQPQQGDVRVGFLPRQTQVHETKQMLGSYDKKIPHEGTTVRICNWVTFLRLTTAHASANLRALLTPEGQPEFEVMRSITPLSPLLVHLSADFPSSCSGVTCQREIDNILQDGPLDLSQSLIYRDESTVNSPVTVSSCTSSPESSPSHISQSIDNIDQSPQSESSLPHNKLSETVSHRKSAEVSVTHRRESSQKVSLTPSVHRLRSSCPQRTLLPCSVCGKTFDRPSLLKRHMRTHTGERPHACDVCDKRFSTSSSLNTHRRIHSGEKPHACGVCGKRFTASSNLYYHRMTHTKVLQPDWQEKPHKCSLCLKSFPTPGDLRSHQYVHSGAWPFRCTACGRGFSKQTNLRNHLFLHTGDKPHVCLICGKKFALACNLRAHAKTHEEGGGDEVAEPTSSPAHAPLSTSVTSSSSATSKSKLHKVKSSVQQQTSINQWDLIPSSYNQQSPVDIGKIASLWNGCSMFPVPMEEIQRMLEAHILLSALQQH